MFPFLRAGKLEIHRIVPVPFVHALGEELSVVAVGGYLVADLYALKIASLDGLPPIAPLCEGTPAYLAMPCGIFAKEMRDE